MDWKFFVTAFSSIFLAELADKTQMVGLGLSAKSGKPLIIWLGSVCAYMLVTAITVVIGAGLGHYIKPELLRYFGGALFLLLGLLMLAGRL